jgi:hypothetical protein
MLILIVCFYWPRSLSNIVRSGNVRAVFYAGNDNSITQHGGFAGGSGEKFVAEHKWQMRQISVNCEW